MFMGLYLGVFCPRNSIPAVSGYEINAPSSLGLRSLLSITCCERGDSFGALALLHAVGRAQEAFYSAVTSQLRVHSAESKV